MGPRSPLPALLLLAAGALFAGATLGSGAPGGDDHPGQLYRLHHALGLGAAPWSFNPGWWAGYAELQYYPPLLSYAGAALVRASLGALSAERAYQALLWVVYLLPGLTTYALLRRTLGQAWLALPGGLVALTLSAGCRSGVEEGLRWGLVAARLGWGLLPLVGLAMLSAQRREGGLLRAGALAVAGVVLAHPSHAPAAGVLVLTAAAMGPAPSGPRRGAAVLGLLAGLGLTGFWLVPLVAHLEMALPLTWGEAGTLALARRLVEYPVLAVLGAACVAGGIVALRARGAARAASVSIAERWLLVQPAAMLLVVAAEALVLAPLGLAWLPADRVSDGLVLALVLGASAVLSMLARAHPGLPGWALALAAVALLPALTWGREEPGLTLRPRPGEWPTLTEVTRGVRMDALWAALREAPPGRVFFLRSAVPLAYRPEWWRPHSHLAALTPVRAGRDVIGGTFTHPSPVAGLVYTGSAARAPITQLAEQRDGVTLFGQPFPTLVPARFGDLARRLGVGIVVATDEDAGRLTFLGEGSGFRPWRRVGPFLLFAAEAPPSLPQRVGSEHRLTLPARPGWVEIPLAWSPLWQARAGSRPLPVRRSELGLLEIEAPGEAVLVTLAHRPGLAEWAGLTLSLISAGILLLGRVRARASPAQS